MTKKKPIVFILLTAFIVFSFWKTKSLVKMKQANSPVATNKSMPATKRTALPKNLVERTPASTGYINQPSLTWENKLRDALKEQGGNSLKEIKILKEKSLVWMRDENPLHVESVIISLKNHKEMESTFRALVDSQTGKVLESWDRTVVDASQIKEDGFKIKLDPRYSN